MDDWTVRVEGLWRKFGTSAQTALKYGMMDSARRLVGINKNSEHLRDGEFWALQDVSFELRRGEALGIMGVNGSGKTTLLRILNGAFSPDKGRVLLRGRVGSLIAAGAGFSPMLTGRENIFINGLLMGLTPYEIRRHFDEIVSFAALEKFIDMPVRNYSSGMTVRLGFSIAILGRPQVLLVDEVLAVGDLEFQKRCYDKMLSIRRNGTTLIFVSHSVGAVWSICDSGLFLDKGVPSPKVSVEELGRLYDLQNYRNAAAQQQRESDQRRNAVDVTPANMKVEEDLANLPRQYGGLEGGTGDALIVQVRLCDIDSWDDCTEFEFGQSIGMEMELYVARPISETIFRYTIDAAQYRFICNVDSTYDNGMGNMDLQPGTYKVRTIVRAPRFLPGSYAVNANLGRRSFDGHLFFRNKAATFVVRPSEKYFFYDFHSPAVVHFESEFQIVDDAESKSDVVLLGRPLTKSSFDVSD